MMLDTARNTEANIPAILNTPLRITYNLLHLHITFNSSHSLDFLE